MSLTVKEKEHWKNRISTRIERAVEDIYRREGAHVRKLIRQEATERVLETFHIRKDYDRCQQLNSQITSLKSQRSEIEEKITQHLVNLGYTFGYSSDYRDPEAFVASQAKLAESDVLLTKDFGQSIIRLRQEQEQLLDTVWLATSSIQIKKLWQEVMTLLGDHPTALQVQAMASESIDPIE